MISVAIVTYNHEKTVGKAVASLADNLAGNRKVSLWVVDNASRDNSLAEAEKWASGISEVNIIKNQKNVGFGRAHNVAIDKVQSKYHVVMNPDVVIHGDVIQRLAAFLDEHEDVGLVVPKVQNADGSIQYLNRRNPTILDLLLRRFAPNCIQKRMTKRMERYEMRDVGYDKMCDVPCASGAFMFCRTQALKYVGGFDERYFLYFEDYDLTMKMNSAGYRAIFYPETTITHEWIRSSHQSFNRATIECVISSIKYFNKWGWHVR